MTDFRNPVETSEMKKPLACMDFDACGNRTGTTCPRQDLPMKGGAERCPNGCQSGGFLFPRYKREDETIHFHQGIDLTPKNALEGPQIPEAADIREREGVRIRAVAGGRVVHSTLRNPKYNIINDAPHESKTSYGHSLTIYNDHLKLYFFYGHCHRVFFAEGDLSRVLSRLLAGLCGMGISACTPEPDPEPRPFEDAWRLELDVPFPYVDPARGNVLIERLTLGGREQDENFANRGHVIVQFDPAGTASQGRIRIEMRRYTMARTAEEAAEVFAALQLWAARGSLVPEPTAENSCLTTWQDECQARVVYRGVSQLARAGADLRVTLPAAYRHLLTIVTEDNVAENDYLRRSEVCVEGLNASTGIEVGSGRVFVVLGPATTPMPKCELLPGGLEDCAAHPEGAWSSSCSCVAEVGDFGRVRVTSSDGAAATATVDVPRGLWANVALVNEGPDQMRGVDPACADGSAMGARCDSCVALDGYVLEPSLGTEVTRTPWINLGMAARPSEAANPSAGFLVNLVSKRCDAVGFTSDPAAFTTDVEAQPIEERGNLQVCHDCLRATGCAGLLAHP